MKILLLSPLLITLSLTFSCSNNQKQNYIISKIIDGDTIWLNNSIKVRIFGIDTPESFDKNNHFHHTTGLQWYYAHLAKEFLVEHWLNKKIQFNRIKLDPYGRTVGIVEFQHRDLAKELLKNGLCRMAYISTSIKSPFYTKRSDYYYDILKIQSFAKIKKIGLWSCDCLKEIYK